MRDVDQIDVVSLRAALGSLQLLDRLPCTLASGTGLKSPWSLIQFRNVYSKEL
jgi:hypothetical protein